MKALRLRSLSVTEAGAKETNDPQDPVEQANRKQRDQHRGRLSSVHRRSRKSVVASQRDDQVRKRIPRTVGQNRFRRRSANENHSVNDSARRRL